MRLRDLKHGQASVWPPSWGRWYDKDDHLPRPEDGVLAGARTKELDRGVVVVEVEMVYQGQGFITILRWDGPPTAEVLATRLSAQIGRQIRELYDVDVE